MLNAIFLSFVHKNIWKLYFFWLFQVCALYWAGKILVKCIKICVCVMTKLEKVKGFSRQCPLYLFSLQNWSVKVSISTTKYPFTILNGRIDPMARDFSHFKHCFSYCWSSVVDTLEALIKLLRDFAVPLARVNGEQFVELCLKSDCGCRKTPTAANLFSVLENKEEVLSLVLRPGQRYRGEKGTEAAAILIQSCWRRYKARTAYLRHCRRKWAAQVMSLSWLLHAQRCRVKRALQARRFSQLENYRSRAQVM